MIINGLRNAGFHVDTCLPPDKKFKNYPRLLLEFWKKRRDCDLVVVGFYGQLIFPFVWLMTRKPILYDVYVSTTGTMIDDRGIGSQNSLKGWLFWLADYVSMQLSDKIILETKAHIRIYEKMFGVPSGKFFHIFLAADDQVIKEKEKPNNNGQFLCHFHGEYAAFHGVRHILHAADLLKDENIHFQIIGTGITYEEDMRLAKKLNLKNCTFIPRVPYDELADYMSRADCCLGFFGVNPRATRVLTNKVIESVAVGRPLINSKNEPIQELLQDGKSALLVERGNPKAIAEAILKLRDNAELRNTIGKNGYEAFKQNCTLQIFSEKLKTVVEEMLHD
jgi:glycosyltransferase involved in cell wall biosynthesis